MKHADSESREPAVHEKYQRVDSGGKVNRRANPVLDSIGVVIERSQDVRTHPDKVREVANWMAYEELPMPDYTLPLSASEKDSDWITDFILTTACVDTAFTDFSNHIKFAVRYAGRDWSDSDALFACVKRALDQGTPFLDGEFLTHLTRSQMEQIFAANIELPMLDEKMQILHDVGRVLLQKYQGRFHNFVRSCSSRLYDAGNGLIERLATEFQRFNDVSEYAGCNVKLYKLAQLAFWFLYLSLRKTGQFYIEDLDQMTAFADYIVPAAFRLLGITTYSEALERAIQTHQLIPRNSHWEIEIRAHCIYAADLLAAEINRIRPAEKQIIVPQIDFRLWSHYHTTWWPHHLTKTIMY
jgi:Potential Queuosine, Q, salvage protein family